MLFYNFANVSPNRQLVLYKEDKTYELPRWFKWIRWALELTAGVGIGILTGGAGFAGVVADFALSSAADLAFNAAFNGGEVDWKDFGISTAFNSVAFIGQSVKAYKNYAKANKLISLANNVSSSEKSLSNILKNDSLSMKIFNSTDEILDANGKIISHYKIFDQSHELIEKALKETTENSFKKTLAISEREYLKVNKSIKSFKKFFVGARSVVSLLTSPRYAGKKVIDLILRKPKQLLTKTWNKFITAKSQAVLKKIGRKSFNELIKNIPINSSWLQSIKIYKAYNPWDIKTCNALLRFNPATTSSRKNPKGKEPVLLISKNVSDIMKLINAPSPGRFYLDNFAYGWEIGKILRHNKEFIVSSKIPLFASLATTLAYTYKTIYYLQKNAKEDKWIWNSNWNDLTSEFFSGVKDNALKGWNFKYLKPITSLAHSTLTHSGAYVLRSGLRHGAKFAWKSNFKSLKRK